MKKLHSNLLLALFIGFTGLLLVSSLTSGHNWGGDFSAYIMQTQSLVEGTPLDFIEANHFTMQYSSYPLGPIVYPWGFPALLAPFYAVFGLNMIALKSVGVITFLLFLILLWLGFRKDHSFVWLLSLICFFALNPTLLMFMNEILSDIPFLLFSTASVMLIGRFIIEKRRLISPVFDNALLGVSMAAAFFIRTNGILLPITLGMTQCIVLAQRLWQRKPAQDNWSSILKQPISLSRADVQALCISLLPYASFISILSLWRALLPEGGSSHMYYLSIVSPDSIIHHWHYYVDLPVEFFTGAPHSYLFYGASVPLAITGGFQRYRKDPHMILYVILTFLLYIFWPPIQGLRFLFPIFPFYVSFGLTGLEIFQRGATGIERILRKTVCLLFILLILFYFGKHSISRAYDNLTHNRETTSGPFVETSRHMFAFVEEYTEPESTIVFFKPRVMRMMTGRNSLMAKDISELSRADYVCLYSGAGGYEQITPDQIDHLSEQGATRLIYESSDFRIYKLTGAPHPGKFFQD